MVDLLGKGGGGQTRAAAEIDGALEECRFFRGDSNRQHRLEQQRRAAIAEVADQRGFEPRRVLVEQHLHIGLRHAGQWLGAEPHQAQTGAVPVQRIGGAGFMERGHRGFALAELLADFAEREPGRGEFRRELNGLLQQVGRSRQIAAQLQVAREIIAAVGNEIAGGQEQAGGHGVQLVVAGEKREARLRPNDPAIHLR